MFRERDNWVIYPFFANLTILVFVYFGLGRLDGDATLCIIIAISAVAVAVSALYGVITLEIGPPKTFASLMAQIVLMVLIFGLIYAGFGVDDTRCVVTADHVCATALSTGLYLSIITWTTLGFGDVVPPAAIRTICAVQAISGYVFFGLLIGMLNDTTASVRKVISGAG